MHARVLIAAVAALAGGSSALASPPSTAPSSVTLPMDLTGATPSVRTSTTQPASKPAKPKRNRTRRAPASKPPASSQSPSQPQ